MFDQGVVEEFCEDFERLPSSYGRAAALANLRTMWAIYYGHAAVDVLTSVAVDRHNRAFTDRGRREGWL